MDYAGFSVPIITYQVITGNYNCSMKGRRVWLIITYQVITGNYNETREAIQGVNFNMVQNTCALQNTMNNNTRDIIDSQNAGTRAILDYLCQDKIATLQAENNDLRLAASQDRQNALLTTAMTAQTNHIINAVNPAA